MTSIDANTKVPEGYELLESFSPFNSMVGPYYVKLGETAISIGLIIQERHCNRSGRLHGAMVGAMFDAVLGQNVGLVIARDSVAGRTSEGDVPTPPPLVTLNLSIDYIGTASVGDWIYATATVQKPGKSIAFVEGQLMCEEKRIAKASGIFRTFDKTQTD